MNDVMGYSQIGVGVVVPTKSQGQSRYKKVASQQFRRKSRAPIIATFPEPNVPDGVLARHNLGAKRAVRAMTMGAVSFNSAARSIWMNVAMILSSRTKLGSFEMISRPGRR